MAKDVSGILDSHIFTDDIGGKIKVVAKKRGIPIAQLARASGISRSHLYEAFNGNAGLSFFDVSKCCSILRVDIGRLHQMDLNFLSELPAEMLDRELLVISVNASQEGKAAISEHAEQLVKEVWEAAMLKRLAPQETPSFDDLIMWWENNNGRFEANDKLQQYLCTYEALDDTGLRLDAKHVGGESLIANQLKTKDPSQIEHYLGALNEAAREEILLSYVKTSGEGSYRLVRRRVIVNIPGVDPYAITYGTLLMPMEKQGYVVNYSKFMSVSPILDQKLGVLGVPNKHLQASRTRGD